MGEHSSSRGRRLGVNAALNMNQGSGFRVSAIARALRPALSLSRSRTPRGEGEGEARTDPEQHSPFSLEESSVFLFADFGRV